MLTITKKHLKTIEKLAKQYRHATVVTPAGAWKDWTDDDIWFRFLASAVVIGAARAHEELFRETTPRDFLERADKTTVHNTRQEDILETVRKVLALFPDTFQQWEIASWDTLWDERDLRRGIVGVRHLLYALLRVCGSRYVSRNLETTPCRKTEGLVRNFRTIFDEGEPTELFLTLGDLPTERDRVEYMMDHFASMGPKSARDFLMDAGMVRNAVAFDIRVRNILEEVVGLALPPKFETRPKLYAEVERAILDDICAPLGIEGVFLDRLLFQNYDRIIR